jgi:outer membrane protein OmpA-like peptidoglycan-associated protein/uncharacterized protein YegP (UPF0339 family)
MSDKDYKGKKGIDGDDYKPLQFYKDRIPNNGDGFAKFTDEGEHYFTYNVDGEIILISEGYTSEKGRDNGIASVDKNRVIEKRYKKDSLDSGRYFFNLIAGNHQEIGTSAWFTSEAAMDAAIARMMGASTAPLDASSIVGNLAAAAPLAAASIPSSPEPAGMRARPAIEDDGEDGSGGGLGWLWWLLPILLALLVWYLLSRCCEKPDADVAVASAPAVVEPAPEPAPEPAVPNVVEAESQSQVTAPEPVVVSDANTNQLTSETTEPEFEGSSDPENKFRLGAFFKSELPGGVELNIPEYGVENNLLQFIQDESKPVDKTTWFNFDRIYFNTGKADLTLESREQIRNIAEIVNAYPNVKLKVGGYTDNTGSLEFNQKLSQERAESVMNSLISQGISQERLVAEGYGPKHPVASNDTEEGRAKNRRIALLVTEK